MKVLGVIPARYGSSRLEGKPLADIHGKPMIQWVYEKAVKAFDQVIVATDDQRIFDAVVGFNGHCVMTGIHHENGTSRCLEASEIWIAENGVTPDVIVNIQGDEPMLNPDHLEELAALFNDNSTQLGTLVTAVKTQDELQSNSNVFVVLNQQDEALYFSRQVIPFIRDLAPSEWMNGHTFFKHIGVYAYSFEALKKMASWSATTLEQCEQLEQLKWLENGGRIKVAKVADQGVSVDTAEDLEKVRTMMQ